MKAISLPPGSRPMSVKVSADGRRIYVSNGRGGTISVLDGRTYELLSSIKVGIRPWGMALSPDGKFLYCANGPSNDVSVVDLETNKEIARIKAGTSPVVGGGRAHLGLSRRRRDHFADHENLLCGDAAGETVLVGSRSDHGGAGELDRLFIQRVAASGHAAVQRIADLGAGFAIQSSRSRPDRQRCRPAATWRAGPEPNAQAGS